MQPSRRARPATIAHAGPGASPAGRRRVRLQHLVVLGGYLAASLAAFGPTILGHLADRVLSSTPQDAAIFVWSLRWWPYALAHGLDPFLPHVVWAPGGINLAWVTSVPGPALVAAPVTLAAGPVVSFNLLSLIAPAAAAWTAYVLCRRLTGSLPASVVGGLVFGFSPDVVTEVAAGHLNLSLVFLVPVVAYLVVRRLEGSIGPRALVGWAAAALTAQFLISTEVFATLALVAAVVGALALLLGPRRLRPLVLRTGGLLALAYGLAGVLVSPYLWAAFAFPRPYKPIARTNLGHGATGWHDLLRYVVPGRTTLLWGPFGGRWGRYGNFWYFGAALLLLLATIWIIGRRRPLVRVLATAFVVIMVFALGPTLTVAGLHVLPWRLVRPLPLLGQAQPGRLVMYAFPIAAVTVAEWLARVRVGRRALAWLALAPALVMIAPNLPASVWTTPVVTPPFFADGTYRAALPPGGIVWVVDRRLGAETVWQAGTGMAFRLAGGFFGLAPPAATDPATQARMGTARLRPGDGPAIARFLRERDVAAVVVYDEPPRIVGMLERALPVSPRGIGGVLLFRLRSR